MDEEPKSENIDGPTTNQWQLPPKYMFLTQRVSKRLNRLYRHYTGIKENKWRHQFPRMTPGEITNKIIKNWNWMSLHKKQKLYDQAVRGGKIQDDSEDTISNPDSDISFEEKVQKRREQEKKRKEVKQKRYQSGYLEDQPNDLNGQIIQKIELKEITETAKLVYKQVAKKMFESFDVLKPTDFNYATKILENAFINAYFNKRIDYFSLQVTSKKALTQLIRVQIKKIQYRELRTYFNELRPKQTSEIQNISEIQIQPYQPINQTTNTQIQRTTRVFDPENYQAYRPEISSDSERDSDHRIRQDEVESDEDPRERKRRMRQQARQKKQIELETKKRRAEYQLNRTVHNRLFQVLRKVLRLSEDGQVRLMETFEKYTGVTQVLYQHNLIEDRLRKSKNSNKQVSRVQCQFCGSQIGTIQQAMLQKNLIFKHFAEHQRNPEAGWAMKLLDLLSQQKTIYVWVQTKTKDFEDWGKCEIKHVTTDYGTSNSERNIPIFYKGHCYFNLVIQTDGQEKIRKIFECQEESQSEQYELEVQPPKVSKEKLIFKKGIKQRPKKSQPKRKEADFAIRTFNDQNDYDDESSSTMYTIMHRNGVFESLSRTNNLWIFANTSKLARMVWTKPFGIDSNLWMMVPFKNFAGLGFAPTYLKCRLQTYNHRVSQREYVEQETQHLRSLLKQILFGVNKGHMQATPSRAWIDRICGVRDIDHSQDLDYWNNRFQHPDLIYMYFTSEYEPPFGKQKQYTYNLWDTLHQIKLPTEKEMPKDCPSLEKMSCEWKTARQICQKVYFGSGQDLIGLVKYMLTITLQNTQFLGSWVKKRYIRALQQQNTQAFFHLKDGMMFPVKDIEENKFEKMTAKQLEQVEDKLMQRQYEKLVEEQKMYGFAQQPQRPRSRRQEWGVVSLTDVLNELKEFSKGL